MYKDKKYFMIIVISDQYNVRRKKGSGCASSDEATQSATKGFAYS